RLRWTATGDDGGVGKATRYDLRYSTALITPGNFASATRAPGAPVPLPSGTVQELRVSGLQFSTRYYFALQVHDELGNPSGISNIVTTTTLGPPNVGVAPTSLSADLITGGTATRTVTISNTGVSELSFEIHARAPPTPGAAGRMPIP